MMACPIITSTEHPDAPILLTNSRWQITKFGRYDIGVIMSAMITDGQDVSVDVMSTSRDRPLFTFHMTSHREHHRLGVINGTYLMECEAGNEIYMMVRSSDNVTIIKGSVSFRLM